jgi:hypothetical protein
MLNATTATSQNVLKVSKQDVDSLIGEVRAYLLISDDALASDVDECVCKNIPNVIKALKELADVDQAGYPKKISKYADLKEVISEALTGTNSFRLIRESQMENRFLQICVENGEALAGKRPMRIPKTNQKIYIDAQKAFKIAVAAVSRSWIKDLAQRLPEGKQKADILTYCAKPIEACGVSFIEDANTKALDRARDGSFIYPSGLKRYPLSGADMLNPVGDLSPAEVDAQQAAGLRNALGQIFGGGTTQAWGIGSTQYSRGVGGRPMSALDLVRMYMNEGSALPFATAATRVSIQQESLKKLNTYSCVCVGIALAGFSAAMISSTILKTASAEVLTNSVKGGLYSALAIGIVGIAVGMVGVIMLGEKYTRAQGQAIQDIGSTVPYPGVMR